jgi:HD-GYP domain-containing protein (c-di-GMP phosphodiesterase class II)/DNA-binding CsgD family transcriptional regulator
VRSASRGAVEDPAAGDLRLADVLAALSVATDLGMGHAPEKAVRSCLFATELAREHGVPEPQVSDVYYTSLLLHLGCTAPAAELAHLVGDERRFLSRAEGTDESDLRQTLGLLGLVGAGTGTRRLRHLLRTVTAGAEATRRVQLATCEVGSRAAARLHLGDGVVAALGDSTEVWDGSGTRGRTGSDIELPARIALLAAQVVLFDRLGGPEAAVRVVRERAGHWFDPELAELVERCGTDLLARAASVDVWSEVVDAEPTPVRRIPSSRLDEVSRVFGELIDLKATATLGHSGGVADLAAGAARRLGCDGEEVTAVRRAALLHDLGRVAVSTDVWDRPRALTSLEWEQVRLHPYHTERILGRSRALEPLARTAGMHHEQPDGGGYHHGASGAAFPLPARLLAAADRFRATTEGRPHRPASTPEEAAEQLLRGAADGRVDGECARAVVAEAGADAAPGPVEWPAGLTDREVEVLRLLARGRSNAGIAEDLVISRRTAEHHVQHIYAKIGGSTRATAAMFAVEHGLVR